MTFYRKHKYLIDRYALFLGIITLSMILAYIFHPLSFLNQ